MRKIDEFFSEVPEGELHHYTSISAVAGIVETRSLWASNACYLNDSSEVVKAIELTSAVATQKQNELPL